MRIFLAPRSNQTSYKNFLSTIEGGVDYSVVEQYLDRSDKKILSARPKLFAWGTKENKKSSWDKMKNGDLVLFYKGREVKESEGKFIFAGTVVCKRQSDDLGEVLWPPKKGEEPWSYVFFLDDLSPIYLPISDLIKAAKYKSNFIVQGFMPLNYQGTSDFLKKHGSFEALVKHYKVEDRSGDETSDLEKSNAITAHAEAELLLLKIGKMLGYDTFTPTNDRSKTAFGERLAEYCTLEKIPSRFLGDNIKIVSQIDVIWFKDDIPKYAFEVEHSTKLNSGFTRLVQLHPLDTRLTIISRNKNHSLFKKYLDSAAFYKHKRSFFFKNYKQLEMFFKSVSEFDKIRQTFLG